MNIRVIGDELHADGQVVAVLAQSGIAATLMQRVVDGLDGAVLGEIPDDTAKPDELADMRSDQAHELLHTAMKRVERSGLLRWSDVQRVIQQFVQGELQ